MGNGALTAAEMEGIHASVVALDALFLEDAQLRNPVDGAGTDVLQRAYGLRLERLGQLAMLEARVAALKARDAAEAVELQDAMTPPDARMQERTFREISVVEEIAGILTISAGAAGAFLTQARRVCSLPSVYGNLSSGAVSWQHARIIADETENLDHAVVALVEHFLDPDAPNPARGCPAGDLSPHGSGPRSGPGANATTPTPSKNATPNPQPTGGSMNSPLTATGWPGSRLTSPPTAPQQSGTRPRPSPAACKAPTKPEPLPRSEPTKWPAASSPPPKPELPPQTPSPAASAAGPPPHQVEIRQAAKNRPLMNSSGSPRSSVPTNQRRASVSPTTLTSEPTITSTQPTTPPPMTTAPAKREPSPIPRPLTRRVPKPGKFPHPAADGADSFTRVLVDPRDGAPLEIGRTSYRLTKAMRQALNLRDGKCTFPGCNNNALDNEADHLTAREHGGTTGISNLAQLCPKHHRLKHNSGWIPTHATKTAPPGWTSPTGRHYPSEQPDREAPRLPEGMPSPEVDGHKLLPSDAPLASPAGVITVDFRPALSPAEECLLRYLRKVRA